MNENLSEIMVDLSDLTQKQKDFLKKEFEVTDAEISNMTADKWSVIRERAFDIEAELIPDNNNEEFSDRCKLAISIVDHNW